MASVVLTPGTRVGHYEVIALLGAGGMGEVYRARDDKLGRQVAIKVLTSTALDADDVRRLEREARAASALNHPGIVTIHDTGSYDGRFVIVMELIEGTTLRHHLRRGALPLKRALQMASQLADALAKAHEIGIVHRDLKPENVMVTSDGHVKIVDFGLAKLTEESPGASGADATLSDRSSLRVLLGTVGYMSPEQASGDTVDFRSDQFAFGTIVYELVTGARAFQRATSVETLAMIINAEPEPPVTLNPKLPAPVVWLIERCLAKDPADRYASTRDLAREIHALREHLDELAPADATPRRRARRRAMAAAVLAIAIGAGAWLAWQWTRGGPDATAGNVTFSQLTFGHGHVPNARFAPDGQAIFYAASWNGAPLQVFETRPSGPESRPLGPASASLASISSSGELALLLGCRLNFANCVGTLARMPRGGGAPREMLEDVVSADWAPDGETLAAIQLAGGEYVLHFPPGKPLYTTEKKIGFMRVSPRGDRIAFVEHDRVDAEAGALKVIDLEGRGTTLTRGHDIMRDVVWSPAGDEIWVTASAQGTNTSVYAVSLSGEQRMILRAPGAINLLDLGRDGRALVAHGLARGRMVWSRGTEARELSWLDWSTVADLSPDGKTVLFSEWGQAVGSAPVVYMRSVDGADAVRLGEGTALALSPDGLWALALRETPAPQLVLLPTGAGTTRVLPSHGLTDLYWARWFPRGGRLLVVGAGADGIPGSFIQDVQNGQLEDVGEKGMLAVLVSPDGRRLLMSDPLSGYQVWPLDGGPPTELEGLDTTDRPIQWTADRQLLYVRESGDLALGVHRFDMVTGKTELLTELIPADLSGVVSVGGGRGQVAATPDGKSFVYTYWTFLRDLFLVEGLPP